MANLRQWKKELKEMIYYGGESDHSDCPRCGTIMNFYGHDENGDFEYGEGHWDCPSCGFTITENEL